jgi:hypothetical protein
MRAFMSDRSMRKRAFGVVRPSVLAFNEATRILAITEPETECVLDSWHADASSDWQRNEWDGESHPYAALAEALAAWIG